MITLTTKISPYELASICFSDYVEHLYTLNEDYTIKDTRLIVKELLTDTKAIKSLIKTPRKDFDSAEDYKDTVKELTKILTNYSIH